MDTPVSSPSGRQLESSPRRSTLANTAGTRGQDSGEALYDAINLDSSSSSDDDTPSDDDDAEYRPEDDDGFYPDGDE
jgi:hypothetical protein